MIVLDPIGDLKRLYNSANQLYNDIANGIINKLSGSTSAGSLENSPSSNLINKIVAPAADALGVDLTHSVDATTKELDKMQQSLSSELRKLFDGYQAYAEQVYEETPRLDEALLLQVLNEATNKQSEFSRFIGGYAPFSTAKKKAMGMYAKLGQDVIDAQQKYTDVQKANELIDRMNMAGQQAMNKLNAAESAKVSRANAKIDSKINQINSAISQINNLANASAAVKSGRVWRDSAEAVLKEANSLIE